LEIRRGGMVGIGFQSGSRIFLRATPVEDDYAVMRDALKAHWGELSAIDSEHQRADVS
jgi:hypothetical protein